MSITVSVDTHGVTAKFKNAEKKYTTEITKEFNRFGLKAVNDAKRLCPVDEGTLRNRISFEPATEQNIKVSIVVAANYAAYVEFGTGNFAGVYVPSLPPDFQEYARTFFVNGKGRMPARPFVYPSVRENLIELKNRLK